jgi:hypothetical protein
MDTNQQYVQQQKIRQDLRRAVLPKIDVGLLHGRVLQICHEGKYCQQALIAFRTLQQQDGYLRVFG